MECNKSYFLYVGHGVLFLLVLFLFISPVKVMAQDSVYNAEEIIDKMLNAYSKLQSYQDEGVVKTISSLEGLPEEDTSFSIYYRYPNEINVAWEGSGFGSDGRSILWSDGLSTKTYYSFSKEAEEVESLLIGISGAMGVSQGIAYTVPMMLLVDVLEMPDGYDGPLTIFESLDNLELIDEELIEGTSCFVISGIMPHDKSSEVTLWIGKNDYLLRQFRKYVPSMKASVSTRTEFPSDMPDWSLETFEIHGNIRVNEEIPDSAMSFNPPR